MWSVPYSLSGFPIKLETSTLGEDYRMDEAESQSEINKWGQKWGLLLTLAGYYCKN